jgi:ferric enterobactin receptor
MRLEATAGYLLKSNQIRVILLLTAFILSFSFFCKSQAYRITFKEKTTLSDALLQSSRTFGFKVAFDAQRLGSVYISKQVKANTIDEFVSNLLQNSGFTYIHLHGSYLVVEASQDKVPPKKTCQLMGSVFDNETGEQLPFASVLLPTQNIVASTSTNGTFSIKNIVSNPMHIIINYIGFYPVDTFINWNNPSIYQSFRLKHKISIIDSVSIKAKRIEMVDYRSDVDFITTINPSKLIDLPVLTETDIFKTLQLMPGISYSENSSELSIRGGSSDQNLVLFDGQTLYNLSHYYGVFSSINPYMVKDIQVYRGGFDSRYGERISGIVDITGKSGNQMKPAFIADINLLSGNLALEVPISKKLTIIAAGRRSYSDIYKTAFASNLFENKEPALSNELNQITSFSEPKFHFYDLNTKINYRISNDENISLSLYGGKDFFNNVYNIKYQYINVINSDSSIISNYGASINWQKQWNGSFFSSVVIGSSGYTNETTNSTGIVRLFSGGLEQAFLPDSINIFETKNRNRLKDYFVSVQNTININSFNQLNFGILLRNNNIYYHKDADKIYVYDNYSQSAWLTSVFVQDRILIGKSLSIKPGIRLSYYDGNQQFYLEPRFAAKYDFTENFSCRIALGHYNQFLSLVNSTQETSYTRSFWVLANDSVNPVLKSNHYIFGLAYQIKNFLFDAEAYYKKYDGVQEYIYLSQFTRNTEFWNYFPHYSTGQQNPTARPSYFINGSGKIFGLDFFLRYKYRNFTSWISYSLSKGTQNFDRINYGAEIPSLMDQTHQLSFSNLFTFGKWNIGSIALFSTGKPYISSTVYQRFLPIIRTYSRMPNFFRFDVSTNYNFKIKAINIKTGISIINLFNTQNYFDTNTRTFDFTNSRFTETNLIPSQKLSLNLFLQVSI